MSVTSPVMMSLRIILVLVFVVTFVDSRIFHNEQDDQVFFAGGPENNFPESLAFCTTVGHEMLGWITMTERYMLQMGLLRGTVQEHWINSTFVNGTHYGSDGSVISSFFGDDKDCLNTESCHVTAMSNGGVQVRGRDMFFKARNICLIHTKKADAINKLEKLWPFLNLDEQNDLTAKLPGPMIRLNVKRIQDLEEELRLRDERIARINAILIKNRLE